MADLIKKNRSFKVKLTSDSELYGRYNGDSPYQAANKALSEIIRTRVKNNQPVDQEINFYLVESTKGSLKKVHQYGGKRIQLDVPVTYKVGDQEIIKNFKNILKKIKRNESSDGVQPSTVKKVSNKKTPAASTTEKTKVATKKVSAKKVIAPPPKATKKVSTKKVTTKKVANDTN